LFRLAVAEDGVFVREHNVLTLLRIVKPRMLLVPWSAIDYARPVRVAWHLSLSVEDQVEMGVKGSPITIVTARGEVKGRIAL
jgi:hypothetical protein